MPTETKVDPFKPAQPHIPGVPVPPNAAVPAKVETPPKTSAASLAPSAPARARSAAAASRSPVALSPSPAARAPSPPPPMLWVGLGIGIAVILGATAIVWWAHSSQSKSGHTPSAVAASTPRIDTAKPAEKVPVGPGEIATSEELSKPWSSKRFVFYNHLTSENVPAIAVRLPGGALWGISLKEPYGTCELAYVTDLDALRSQFHFAAEHPMVVNPCTGAVYDLARYESGPNGLVRGAVVHGAAVRPPVGIEVVARGNHIVATRIE